MSIKVLQFSANIQKILIMIQKFLTNNLIEITEDENVEKLLKASTTLEKKLSKDKRKIPTFTLIALDSEIKVSDPNVQEVQQLIINNWKTFTSNCKDTPITYIRAVILETLEKLTSDINVANVVFLSSRNITKHLNLRGKEKEIITSFLTELGNKIEIVAAENLSISKESKIQELQLEIGKITGVSIGHEELKNHLKAASIHSGLGDGGENPQYPGSNEKIWPNFFSERAAKGIAEIINKALNKENSSLNEIQGKIQFFLNNLIKEASQTNSSLRLRTDLLWWKEACYSKTLNDSYRNAQNGLLQLVLALDYSSSVPFIYPQSADYFLKETHAGIISVEDKKIKLAEIFKSIDSSKETLKQYLGEESFEIERVSLTQFIKGYVYGKYSIKQLKDLVGISENIELTLSEFTLWFFHDLQVLNYSKSK